MLQTALFYLISAGVIISSLGVITSRSAVYSVLWLVAAMCMLAGLFVLLKAFLVATILVLVYAGAILVLFLFVVMLIDFRKISAQWQGLKLSPLLAVALGVLIFAQTFGVIRTVPAGKSPAVTGSTEAVGRLLFTNYILPFELTAFLLLAAVVSVVVLAKKDPQ
ncbi:MAG: NADH-quinone oxidoreductase subunit J [Candidatus Omnitrophota bacterium]